MALLERFQVVLAHAPPRLGAAVELPRAVHGQPCRRVAQNQPLHRVHPGQTREEVLRMAREDGLHVRFVALQQERACTDGALGFLQVAEFLDDFAGNYRHGLRRGQHVKGSEEQS